MLFATSGQTERQEIDTLFIAGENRKWTATHAPCSISAAATTTTTTTMNVISITAMYLMHSVKPRSHFYNTSPMGVLVRYDDLANVCRTIISKSQQSLKTLFTVFRMYTGTPLYEHYLPFAVEFGGKNDSHWLETCAVVSENCQQAEGLKM